jgi:diaminopimelate epimerase
MKSVLKFYKMQGCGNDFIVIDKKQLKDDLKHEQIKLICDRNYGVGCDQLLIFNTKKNGVVELLIYNQDASIALNCGNGIRCIGMLMYILKEKKEVEVQITGSNEVKTTVLSNNSPLSGTVYAELGEYSRVQNDDGMDVYIGNKHLVIPFDNLSDVDIAYGKYLSEKRDTNVSFVEYNGLHAKARVYERGVGETKACGSAAAAIQIASMNSYEISVEFVNSGKIIKAGSKLNANGNNIAYIIGAAELVYDGNFYFKHN